MSKKKSENITDALQHNQNTNEKAKVLADKEAFVYILKCADETLYSGYTTDVQKRLKAHNLKKGAKYTKSRLPVHLVYSEKCASKSDALKREHEIKKYTKQQKQQLINGQSTKK